MDQVSEFKKKQQNIIKVPENEKKLENQFGISSEKLKPK